MKTVCVQVIDLIDLILFEKFSCKKFLLRQIGYDGIMNFLRRTAAHGASQYFSPCQTG